VRIFRDETSLSATPGLWPTIERALQASDWFVLMASPSSAASIWVQKEIEWWILNRDPDRILLAHTDGVIKWSGSDFDWGATTAIPRQLSGSFTQEPFWVDLRKLRPDKETSAKPKLGDIVAEFAAPIRGRDKDTLVGEHVRYQRRTRRLVQAIIASLTSLLLIAVVAAGVAIAQANAADAQRREALLQRDIATSRLLAANADLATGTDPQLAALLAAAAFAIHDTPEARTSMLRQLENQTRGRARMERYISVDTGPIDRISFSTDGQTLATGGKDVALWDWSAGTQISSLPGSADSVAFDPHGNRLAIAGGDEVTVWDTARGEKLASFPSRTGKPPVAFSPDGTLLAIGGIDFTTIVVWDIATRTEVASMTMPSSTDAPQEGLGNSAIAFSPDGALLVADATYHTGVVVFDVDRGEHIASLEGGVNCGPPLSLAFSPDGHTIAAGCSIHSAAIVLWDQLLGTELARLQADGDVYTLAFSPDGLTLASGDASGHVALWDMAELTRTETLTAHTAEVNSVAFSPDGKTLASSSNDTNVIIWSIGDQNPVASSTLPASGKPVGFNAKGDLLAVRSGTDGTDTTVWDVNRRIQIASLSSAGMPLGFAAGDRIVIARDQGLALWDVGREDRVSALNLPTAAVGAGTAPYGARPVALSRDGQTMATVTGDGTTFSVWDMERDRGIASLPAPRGVSSLAFAADPNALAVGEGGGPIVVWNVSRSMRQAEFSVDTLGGQIVTVAMSADGRMLASLQPSGQPQTAPFGCFSCDVILWDIDQRARASTLSGHSVQPDSVAFSPDSQILASTGGNEAILWSIPQNAQMATLTPAAGPAIFSPDGSTLATASADGSVVLWDTDPASWQRRLCTLAGRDLTATEWSAYLPDQPRRPACAA
jgi:WD40 repeat protein